jgi:serine/threonine protein kinase
MIDASPEMMSVFCGALERPPGADRSGYLDAACGNDPELRARIEALLKAHDDVGGPTPAIPGRPATVDGPLAEHAGAVVGPYKLLEPIGEGGFGVVYLAEQTAPVRRKVAVKVLKAGMDIGQVLHRLVGCDRPARVRRTMERWLRRNEEARFYHWKRRNRLPPRRLGPETQGIQ